MMEVRSTVGKELEWFAFIGNFREHSSDRDLDHGITGRNYGFGFSGT